MPPSLDPGDQSVGVLGRPPWSAAAALVGLPQWRKHLILRTKSGTRASRADQGVRPTNSAAFRLLGLIEWNWARRPVLLLALLGVQGLAAQWGGELRLSIRSEPPSFHPALADSDAAETSRYR